jgi:hypothetical protein
MCVIPPNFDFFELKRFGCSHYLAGAHSSLFFLPLVNPFSIIEHT